MAKLICPRCMRVFNKSKNGNCPECNLNPSNVYEFRNSDEYLKKEIPRVLKERKKLGLSGLVGGLEFVIINTELAYLPAAVNEFLRYTGLDFITAFEDSNYLTCVLQRTGSADFLIRARKDKKNPFLQFNKYLKSKHLPNTRLETFVFITKDIEKYFSIQKSRGVRFLTNDIIRNDSFSFIQTIPSSFTGNSIGFIQWHSKPDNFITAESKILNWKFKKPNRKYLKNIKQLDHAATRVRAQDRDAAIIEFMELTNYNFDFALYIKPFNSITNVARLTKKDFAMVFTSGITPYGSEKLAGPTEKFIQSYGTRVHHIAFRTEHIENTFKAIKDDGMKFLIELVGSPKEGLKQTFTVPSKNTLLVNEYIHRYKGFYGFFTKSNTTLLTGATAKQ
jgi:4-hydroxyphenylpyruvate dioxygenase-like putative hemolysin